MAIRNFKKKKRKKETNAVIKDVEEFSRGKKVGKQNIYISI